LTSLRRPDSFFVSLQVREKRLTRRLIGFRFAELALLSLALAGCAVSQKHAGPQAAIRPALDANQTQLVDSYNRQADAVRAVNASVQMSPTAGSAYSGVIHQYHQVSGFVLAAKPAMIRVIGQAPVVATNIFDMVSDGQTFRIFIPSKNEFLVGSTQLERATTNPIENLRPQHLLDAFFWTPIRAGEPVVLEQVEAPAARYYAVSVLRETGSNLEIARKIWFDRSDLRVSRIQIYGPAGRLDSDISYADWQDVSLSNSQDNGAPATASDKLAATPLIFPRTFRIARPQQDYQLSVVITKLALNTDIPPDRFSLMQPAGTELVNLGAGQQEPQP
jgi:outer membrane lipoprotein-sorting protein